MISCLWTLEDEQHCVFQPYTVQRMAPQGSQHTPATVLLPQHRI